MAKRSKEEREEERKKELLELLADWKKKNEEAEGDEYSVVLYYTYNDNQNGRYYNNVK